MGAWSFRRGEPDSGYNAAVAEGAPATATHHVSPALSPTRFAARFQGDALPATIHDDATTLDPREVARWAFTAGAAYRQGDPASGYAGDPGSNGGRMGDVRDRVVANLPGILPATIHDDATTLDPREVARWAAIQANTQKSGGFDSCKVGPPGARHPMHMGDLADRGAWSGGLPATIHDDATTLDPREVARWLFVSGNRAPFRDVFMPAPKGINSDCNASPRGIARVLDGDQAMRDRWACPAISSGTLPATIHDDATTLDPREVARWAWVAKRTAYMDCPEARGGTYLKAQPDKGHLRWPPDSPARAVGSCGTLPATIHDDATTAPIPDPLPAGTLVFIDPPYVGTTGYAHDLDRPAVVRLAQQWAAAGARVMISEAVPIDALVACGWHAVEITAMRVGQRRTFSKQQREWVTCSFQPDPRAVRACEWAADRAKRAAQALKGGDQIGLFGGAEE